MFPTCKNSQKRVKNQKSTDKHSSFDGLIQEDTDLSDIYLAIPQPLYKSPLCNRIRVLVEVDGTYKMKIVKNLQVTFPNMFYRGADFEQIVLRSKKYSS